MGSGSVPGSAASTTSVSGVSSSAPVPFAKAGSRQLHTKISAKHNASTRLASGSFFAVCFARFLRIFHALLWCRVRGRVHSRCLATKKPHPHPACHSGVECSRTIFWFSGVSLRGMPAQKTPSFASPAHARFAKVFSFAGCSRLLVLSYTVRDAKGVIRWRGADFSAWPPGPCTGIILPNLALSMQVSKWTQKRNLRLFLSKISHFL